MGLLFLCELHFLTSLYAETFFNKVLFAFCIKKKFLLSTLFLFFALLRCFVASLHLLLFFFLSLFCSFAAFYIFFFTFLKVKSLFLIFFIIYNQQVIWFFQSSSETIREESLYLKNKCYFFHLIYLKSILEKLILYFFLYLLTSLLILYLIFILLLLLPFFLTVVFILLCLTLVLLWCIPILFYIHFLNIRFLLVNTI